MTGAGIGTLVSPGWDDSARSRLPFDTLDKVATHIAYGFDYRSKSPTLLSDDIYQSIWLQFLKMPPTTRSGAYRAALWVLIGLRRNNARQHIPQRCLAYPSEQARMEAHAELSLLREHEAYWKL